MRLQCAEEKQKAQVELTLENFENEKIRETYGAKSKKVILVEGSKAFGPRGRNQYTRKKWKM